MSDAEFDLSGHQFREDFIAARDADPIFTLAAQAVWAGFTESRLVEVLRPLFGDSVLLNPTANKLLNYVRDIKRDGLVVANELRLQEVRNR